MIITFVGHGTLHIDANLSDKIVAAIKKNIKGKEITTFYCGGYGDFDNHCASICRKLKSEINCEVVFVTPYITPSQQEKMKYLIDSKLYDSTVYPPIENALPRYAITKRKLEKQRALQSATVKFESFDEFAKKSVSSSNSNNVSFGNLPTGAILPV